MTWLYKLFNKPGNLEEFADKAKKEGYGRVNISLTLGSTFREPHFAVVQAGDIKFTYHSCDPKKPLTKGYCPAPSEKPLTERYQPRRSKYTGFHDALEAAKILKKLGLKVLFDDNDAEESLEERVKEYLTPPKLPRAVYRKNPA